MELLAIDSLLTVVTDPRLCGLRAWLDPALVAWQRARDGADAYADVLPQGLEAAGWRGISSSSDTQVPLPQLVGLLRADPCLAVLLDRRGGVRLPDEAHPVLDAWWRRSCDAGPASSAPPAPTGSGDGARDGTTTGHRALTMVATLGIGRDRQPQAQLYALSFPAPSWRWLTRPQLEHASVRQHVLRLDEARYAGQAGALAERARPLLAHARTVHLSAAPRSPRAGWPAASPGTPTAE